MNNSARISAPDLRQCPPRSPRCRLGGYVTVPRMLDKGRATIMGRNGEFNYDAPFDQHVINFFGFDPVERVRAELGTISVLLHNASSSAGGGLLASRRPAFDRLDVGAGFASAT